MSNEEMKRNHSMVVGLLSLLLLVLAFGGTSLICHMVQDTESDRVVETEKCDSTFKTNGSKVGLCREMTFGWKDHGPDSVSIVGYGFGENGWEYSNERETTFDGQYDWYDFANAEPGTYRFTFRGSDGDWANLDCPYSSEHCHLDEMSTFSICMAVKEDGLEMASFAECERS